jgi:hypothetical protein
MIMASQKFHFKGFTLIKGDIKIKVSLDRFSSQFLDAQRTLDNLIMKSMDPYMPKQTGNFIQRTRAASSSMAGTGRVVAAEAPMGRFLYEGKGMVDEVTGSPWARSKTKKVLVSEFGGKTNAKENLTFATNVNPKAVPNWFDAAKEADCKKWIKETKRVAGGK